MKIRLKKFLLVILAFSALTMISLNLLSSLPIQEDATQKMPDGPVVFRPWRRNNRPIKILSGQHNSSWTDWIINFLFPPMVLLRNSSTGSPCKEKPLWPIGFNETKDRVLNQLRFSLPALNQSSHLNGTNRNYQNSTDNLKTILVLSGTKDVGRQRFLDDNCPINNCFLTRDLREAPSADVVLFRERVPAFKLKKPPNQIWIIYMLESALNTAAFGSFNNLINMTATYRMDSTIVTPYERFVPYKNASQYQLLPPKRNYASGKHKKVAWFVSNCAARNNRLEYAHELSKYIDVDIYGPCGKLKCPRSSKKCFEMLNTDYKFYLAFENSNCKDYITEKLYWNGLLNDVLPIVMGARPEDYAKVAPPNSYIHVDEFDSPQQLAAYLHRLDRNDKLYNEYFRWKGSGHYINTKFYCRLCAMINDNTRLAWYEDLETWWRGPGICVKASKDNKYASWKLEPKFSYSKMLVKTSNSTRYNPQYIRLSSNTSAQHNECN